MAQKDKNKKEKGHSFYREAESTWREYDGKFSWKKFWKSLFKFSKIGAGLFLATSAIWGCVQGFIISTSTQIAKGLETYMTYGQVLPNFYAVEENFSYQVQTDVYLDNPYNASAPVNSSNWVNQNGLAPLPFLIENPEYAKTPFLKGDSGYDSKNPKHILIDRDINGSGNKKADAADIAFWEYNVGQYLYLKPAQFAFTASAYSLPTLAYQASILDTTFLNNYLGNQFDNISSSIGTDGIEFGGNYLRPSSSIWALQYDFKDGDGSVPVWRKINSEGTGYEYIKKTLGDQDGFVVQNPDKDSGVMMYKKNTFVAPANWEVTSDDWYYDQEAAFAGSSVQWSHYEFINLNPSLSSNKYTLAADQAIYSINTYQFLKNNPTSGTIKASSVQLKDPNDSNLTITLEDVLEDLKLQAAADDSLTTEEKTEAETALSYAIQYTCFLPSVAFDSDDFSNGQMGLTGINISPPTPPTFPLVSLEEMYGVSLMVVPTGDIPTLAPSMEALETMKGLRTSNYYEERGYGRDPKTANAGWMLLGDKPEDSPSYENIRDLYVSYDSNGVENTSLTWAAQQKTAWKGEYNYGVTANERENILEYKLKDAIDTGNEYAQMSDISFSVDGEIYNTTNLYSQIYGFSSLKEQGLSSGQPGYVAPKTQLGITNNVTVYTDPLDPPGDNYKTETLSALDYSVKGSGDSDYDNVNRFSMVSWSEAWAWGGPYYGMFVLPLSKLSMWVQSLMSYDAMGGWSVVLGVLLIIVMLRGLGTLLSWRKNNAQNKMQELQLQVSAIKAKYSDHKENKQAKQRMQMEIQALYRKNGVNPLSSLSTMLVTLPIFLALWTIISAIPIYKIATMGAFVFALNPLKGIFNTGLMGFMYLLFALVIIGVQVLSTKLPNWLSNKRKNIKNLDEATKAQMKKSNRTMTIMLVVFIILGFTIPTLLGLYWVFSGMFTTGVTLFQHYKTERKSSERKSQN